MSSPSEVEKGKVNLLSPPEYKSVCLFSFVRSVFVDVMRTQTGGVVDSSTESRRFSQSDPRVSPRRTRWGRDVRVVDRVPTVWYR